MRRVAITGASGLLGTLLMQGVNERYSVLGIDRARLDAGVRRVDLAKTRALDALFPGADAVVHLAANADASTPWKEVLKNNVPATMNALEAARRAGVQRFVFASSNHVTGMYEQEEPYASIVAGDYAGLEPAAIPLIGPDWALRPDGAYALGKALGEAAARHYADAFDLSVVCLRIGTVNVEDRPLEPRHYSTLLTHVDLLRLVECALEAPAELRFGIYYGVSRNTWRIWDLGNAQEEIGYEPRDDAEALRPASS